MKNIPKICHFVWTTGASLSLLQAMSVISFHNQNPDWDIILHLIKQTPEELGKNIYVLEYTGPDYLSKLVKLDYVKVHGVDLKKEGIGCDKHSILVSDILRVKYLYEMGGVYSDIDMLWLRPMDQFHNIQCNGNPKDFETTICEYKGGKYLKKHFKEGKYSRRHFNASNIVSEPGGQYLKKLLDYQKIIKPPYTYQAFNTDMLNSLFENDLVVLNDYPRMLSIDYSVFCPYSIFDLELLYNRTDLSVLHSGIMGVHWFNGHELSREYVDENIKGFKRPCSMTEIILTLITGKL